MAVAAAELRGGSPTDAGLPLDFDPDEGKTYTARPVIDLELCMGKTLRTIEVNLTDRSAFQYPLLIGSEALKHFEAMVDPSLKYAAGKPGCTDDATPGE